MTLLVGQVWSGHRPFAHKWNYELSLLSVIGWENIKEHFIASLQTNFEYGVNNAENVRTDF